MEKRAIDKYCFAVDVGNTVTRLGLFLGDEIKKTWSVTTQQRITVDEIRLLLFNFNQLIQKESLAGWGESSEQSLPDSILSCVIPDITDIWVAALSIECKRPPLIVGPGLKTGIKMIYNDPSELGSDRIADMVASKNTFEAPLIIIDFGTVTTLQVLDKTATFIGGIIAPGMALASRSISESAARLPVIDIKVPLSPLGKTTREAMQSGVVLGEVARIDGLINMIWDELNYKTSIVSTGADAELFKSLTTHSVNVDEMLTLRGLNHLYKINRKQ